MMLHTAIQAAPAATTVRKRDIHGIVLLDKEPGITSNRALQTVKRLFQARKAGHTGSLDPLASGMLPICLGEATKMSGFLLEADKRYRVSIQLGVRTSTGDAEGEIVDRRAVDNLERAPIRRVLGDFTGPIEQIPPMHSAIKRNGQPLYKLAHRGIEVAREPRSVRIHTLVLHGIAGDVLDIEVHCSKGTYIRTLAEDIGEALGYGGHVQALRRLAVGPFEADKMVSLEALAERAARGEAAIREVLRPADSALAQLPEVNLTAEVAFFIRRGQAVRVQHAPRSGWVKLYAPDQRFIGVGRVLEDGRVAPQRLVKS